MASTVQAIRSPDGGYHDSLDGTRLKPDERLIIRWPSGSIQVVLVEIVTTYLGVTHGDETISVPCGKAYAKVLVFGGTAARFPLLGFRAQRM